MAARLGKVGRATYDTKRAQVRTQTVWLVIQPAHFLVERPRDMDRVDAAIDLGSEFLLVLRHRR